MTDIDTKSRNRSRLTLIGLVSLFLIPVIAAIVLHSVGGGVGPSHTVNRGELLRPVIAMGEQQLLNLQGQSMPADYFIGKWTMVYIHSGECESLCQTNLYNVRQSRLALGGEKERIQRLLVIADGKPTEGLLSLLEQHPGMDTVTVQQLDRFLDIFRAPDNTPVTDRIYLVDPLGNFMMRYPQDMPPKGVIKDMERLLKYSKIG